MNQNTMNSLNQYTSATENNVQLDFAYDLDGSMTYRPVDATSGWTQVWNCENRMAETYKGNDRLTFRYDYMGRRVEKCVYSGNTLTSKTFFVYDGFKCIEELDALDSNAVLICRTWQPFDVGLDVILASVDAFGISCFLFDTNKNVVQKTNANGLLVENNFYTPFGETYNSNTSYIGFSSEKKDIYNMLIYYNFRYLDAKIGRWDKKDPFEENYGLNLYAFVMNDPINYIDFNGLFTLVVIPHQYDFGVPMRPQQKVDYLSALLQYYSFYKQMRKANIIGSDKYFHCMAHCNLARSTSKDFANTMGKLRESTDMLKIQLLYSLLLSQNSQTSPEMTNVIIEEMLKALREQERDSQEDFAANSAGIDCECGKQCSECCLEYVKSDNPNNPGQPIMSQESIKLLIKFLEQTGKKERVR